MNGVPIYRVVAVGVVRDEAVCSVLVSEVGADACLRQNIPGGIVSELLRHQPVLPDIDKAVESVVIEGFGQVLGIVLPLCQVSDKVVLVCPVLDARRGDAVVPDPETGPAGLCGAGQGREDLSAEYRPAGPAHPAESAGCAQAHRPDHAGIQPVAGVSLAAADAGQLLRPVPDQVAR